MSLVQIGLGGGCHWCTEAVFAALHGVDRVDQGFIRSCAPDASWSEAVIAHFDPRAIPLEILIEVHLHTHASTSNHKMRCKYRSAVYAFDAMQARQAQAALKGLQAGFDMPLITRVLAFGGFKASDERFRNYHSKNAQAPFCTRYIDPKLELLRKNFSGLMPG